MSIRLMTAIWDGGLLKGSDLLVLLALADAANDSGYCYPSVSRLAARARIGERAVQKVLARLESEGHITRDSTGGKGRTSRYWVHPKGEPEATLSDQPKGEPEDTLSGQRVNCGSPKGEQASSPEPSGTVKTDDDHRASASEVDQLKDAAGVDPSKHLPRQWEDPDVEWFIAQWQSHLGLTFEEILSEVRRVSARRSGPPPSTPKYFQRAMQEAAGAKGTPALRPIEGGRSPPVQPIDFDRIWAAGGKQ